MFSILIGMSSSLGMSTTIRSITPMTLNKCKDCVDCWDVLYNGKMFLSQLSPTSWYFLQLPSAQLSLTVTSSSSKWSCHVLSLFCTVLGTTLIPIFASLSISWNEQIYLLLISEIKRMLPKGCARQPYEMSSKYSLDDISNLFSSFQDIAPEKQSL